MPEKAAFSNFYSRFRFTSGEKSGIAGFETNRLILPADIKLTPYCLFLRGMDYHLSQQFDEAFQAWNAVALSEETPPNLKSLAWYWIGYENNNLGKFSEAYVSFEKAMESAQGPRRWELRRIGLESKFFNKKRETAESLIEPFQNLLKTIEEEGGGEEVRSKRMRTLTTLGNVYWVAGNERMKTDGFDQAKAYYERAKECFQEASVQDKWALFGLAEALYVLKLRGAEDLFENRIREQAKDEYVRREEPRTKVLARTSELICCLRVHALHPEIPGIYSQVIEALGRVDERLTVYSQLQRRNVRKDELRQ
jgi:tetratricopeptide (TPR) repeat protein